jgi:hypothetical protein
MVVPLRALKSPRVRRRAMMILRRSVIREGVVVAAQAIALRGVEVLGVAMVNAVVTDVRVVRALEVGETTMSVAEAPSVDARAQQEVAVVTVRALIKKVTRVSRRLLLWAVAATRPAVRAKRALQIGGADRAMIVAHGVSMTGERAVRAVASSNESVRLDAVVPDLVVPPGGEIAVKVVVSACLGRRTESVQREVRLSVDSRI